MIGVTETALQRKHVHLVVLKPQQLWSVESKQHHYHYGIYWWTSQTATVNKLCWVWVKKSWCLGETVGPARGRWQYKMSARHLSTTWTRERKHKNRLRVYKRCMPLSEGHSTWQIRVHYGPNIIRSKLYVGLLLQKPRCLINRDWGSGNWEERAPLEGSSPQV